MKHIQIWSTGYQDNGGQSGAVLLFETQAKNFDEAVEKFNSERKEGELKIDRVTRNGFSSEEGYLNRDHEYRFWGCSLYDNEKQARVAFG